MKTLKIGQLVQYNKKYKASELCTILNILGNHCLILFPSGTKICTKLSGLYEYNQI